MFSLNTDMYSILFAMNQTSFARSKALLRLSTGLRINSGADDPAGLVALKSLQSELTAIQAASDNGTRANAMMNVADGALNEVSSLVTTIQGLTVELANDGALTSAEKQAKQLEIDTAVASIDRLLGTTTFNGKQLFNGVFNIQTAGVDTSKLTDVDITGRQAVVTSATLNVTVTDDAEKAILTFSGATLTNSAQVTFTGNLGSVTLDLNSGDTISQAASSINANTTSTGVEAVASNNVLYIRSEELGEDEFVSVNVLSGTLTLTGGATQDFGDDATVTINGQGTGVNGLDVSFNVNGITGTITLSESFAASTGGTESFSVGTGGATFALTPDVSNRFTIGIGQLTSSGLGNGSFGFLSEIKSGGSKNALNNAGLAIRIADAASIKVARARANIGAFQKYTVGSFQKSLATAETSISSAMSQIGDTDFALEMANLTRQNILMQVQISVMSLISQQQSSIIGLLGGL